MNCNNCNTEFASNYCPECGQPARIKRINRHYIVHEIEHVLHFEKGILYTIRELLLRPGQNVRHFVVENRSRLVKPIIFIIVTSLIYSIINHFFHIEEGYMKFDGNKMPATTSMIKWFQDHYGYANILMGMFIALWTKSFFKKYEYNFYEILILLCFVMGMAMLIYAAFAIIQGLTHLNAMQIAGPVGIIYCSWAIGQFFDKNKPLNYFKSFCAYLLGMITFMVAVAIIGVSIDLLIRH
jgi:uncharacterized membrane protein YbjE (DUF340 family)